MNNQQIFVRDADIPWEVVGQGVRRKIMSYDRQLMLVRVEFQAGGVGALHQHYHSQISHVESGVFELQIGDDKKILRAGDVYRVPSNMVHGCICLEAGVLIDAFSPMREDFV